MISPLLSIVIANYNYGRFIEDAIMSVLSECVIDTDDKGFPLLRIRGTDAMLELIVCDGGSTDESVEIIKRHGDKISWWCSEKDKGQSDAFNKGFAHAKGKYLTWLNADDVLMPGALRRLVAAISRNPQTEWFVGGCVWLDADLKVMRCTRARRFSKTSAKCGCLVVYSPSSIFSKSLLDRVGGVDVNLHYQMDAELWHRFFFEGRSEYKLVSGYLFGLRIHPDAKMSCNQFEGPKAEANRMKRKAEDDRVHARYPRRRIPLIMKILEYGFFKKLKSFLDTMRYNGCDYKKVEAC